MRKILTGVVAAATLAAAATVAPTTADARWGWRPGAFIGGLAAGAIIGGAIARPYYAYPRYYAYPAPVYAPRCIWHNVWTAYGWRRVCT